MKKLWQDHRWLTATCAAMILLFGANLVGLAVDPRVITGAPAWLKPAKFSLSTAIYAGTLVWVIGQIRIWPRFVAAMGTVTAITLVVELFIINLQAWRGTTSHFNLTTGLNASLFLMMGISIAVLWLASVGLAVALFRQKFSNAAFGWALRLGMLITVLGEASGGLMTRPMPGQTSGIIGSHTVGAPDGGAMIPGTGWSADHGDLRVAHFLGLHGIQATTLLYLLLARKRRPQTATVCVTAAAYFSAFVLLDWQALRGQSILHWDAETIGSWTAWLVTFSSAAVLIEMLSQGRRTSPDFARLV